VVPSPCCLEPLTRDVESWHRRTMSDGSIDSAPEDDATTLSERAAAFRAAAVPDSSADPGVRLVETGLVPGRGQAVSLVNPQQAAAFLHAMIGKADREHFVTLLLDNKHRLTHAHVVSRGSLRDATVHPRETFKAAILANAAAMVVGHNHPSGDVRPSPDDTLVLQRLKEAGDLIGIPVLDGLIVGPTRVFYAESIGQAVSREGPLASSPETRALERLCETAEFLLSGTAGDLFEESAEDLSRGILAFAHERRDEPQPQNLRAALLERALHRVLDDIEEGLARHGGTWWDDSVSAGGTHRDRAARLVGRRPYGPEIRETPESGGPA
jgi:DNA repair protein RadC